MTRTRKMTWKIGVKSQASVLPMSAPATAGQRFGARVGAGVWASGVGEAFGSGVGVAVGVGLGQGAEVDEGPGVPAGGEAAGLGAAAKTGAPMRRPSSSTRPATRPSLMRRSAFTFFVSSLPRRPASADRIVASRVPGVAAGDALHTHPAPLQQPVALDGLLRVARAGRVEATRGREPGEGDPVEADKP